MLKEWKDEKCCISQSHLVKFKGHYSQMEKFMLLIVMVFCSLVFNVILFFQVRQKAEGYAEGATTLYNEVPVSRFINSSNFIDVLQEASEVPFLPSSHFMNLTTVVILVEGYIA